MTILMLFPPQWTPIAPSIGIPILNAQLKKAGFNTKIKDLNIEFYNDILKKDFLTKMLEKSKSLLPELEKEIQTNKYSNEHLNSYPLETRTLIYKYSYIKNYMENKLDKADYIINSIEEALSTFKTKEKFYNPESLHEAQHITKAALEMALLPYAPTKILLDYFKNPLLKLTYDSIKFHCLDKTTNIFLDYYEEKIEDLLSEDINCVAIAINTDAQILAGLTLGYLIKQKSNIHVNIGGDYFRRVVESVQKYPELFDLFCDSFLVEDAEESIVELARYCNDEIKIEEVPGLVYKKSKENIILNPVKPPRNLNELENMTLEGFDLEKYFTPEIVIPLKSNRHCYWDQCTFCDLYYGAKYNEKRPEKLIEEIKHLKETYNISYFEFIDSSVRPEYFDKMADLIFENNLNIKYFSFARIKRTFTKKLLNKASKSGLKMLLWGLESANERIIKLMNKGSDFKDKLDIFKDANEAGIWNFVFTMLGFPTETKKEAEETINFVTKNTKVFQPIFPSTFVLKKHAKILNNMEAIGITKIEEDTDNFHDACQFESKGMSQKEILNLIEKYEKQYKKSIKQEKPLWHSIRLREHFFLYLDYYGIDWMKKSEEVDQKTRIK